MSEARTPSGNRRLRVLGRTYRGSATVESTGDGPFSSHTGRASCRGRLRVATWIIPTGVGTGRGNVIGVPRRSRRRHASGCHPSWGRSPADCPRPRPGPSQPPRGSSPLRPWWDPWRPPEDWGPRPQGRPSARSCRRPHLRRRLPERAWRRQSPRALCSGSPAAGGTATPAPRPARATGRPSPSHPCPRIAAARYSAFEVGTASTTSVPGRFFWRLAASRIDDDLGIGGPQVGHPADHFAQIQRGPELHVRVTELAGDDLARSRSPRPCRRR